MKCKMLKVIGDNEKDKDKEENKNIEYVPILRDEY